jgi:copper(I)-binding protein
MLLPVAGLAGDLKVERAMIPLAPPAAKVHAAYMTLTNTSDRALQIVGIRADGYAMAHLHQSRVENGVVAMQPVHLLEIAPGQTVTMEHGGFHVMLMQPEKPSRKGAEVALSLELSDGTAIPFTATVTAVTHRHGS